MPSLNFRHSYHNLQCLTPPPDGSKIVEQERLSATRENWKRCHRLIGGPWLAQFEYTGAKERNFDIRWAEEWFYERLGYEIREVMGGDVLWEGQIYEIDLTYKGWHQRRSLRKVRNAVKILYLDDGEQKETTFAANAHSIAQYGRIEERFPLEDETVTQTEAEAERDAMLAEVSEAHPEPIRIHKNNEDRLKVSVQGWVFTANNTYVTAGDGSNSTVSDYADAIIGTDLQFITNAAIATNAATVTQGDSIIPRAWDRLVSLIGKRSNPEEPPFIFRVNPGRTMDYLQLDTRPDYLWTNEMIATIAGAVYEELPWRMTPGIIRNPRAATLTPLPGTFFESGGDALIYEVWMGDGYEMPAISTTRFSDAALLKHLSMSMIATNYQEEQEAARRDR